MHQSRKLTTKVAALLTFLAMLLCLHNTTGYAQPSNAGAGPAQNPQASAPGKPATNTSPDQPQSSPTPAPGKHRHKHKHKHRLPQIPPVPPPSLL